jgi:hypothetical protein
MASGVIHPPAGDSVWAQLANQIIGGIMSTVVPTMYAMSRAAIKNAAQQGMAIAGAAAAPVVAGLLGGQGQ